jgi:CubicO group peptidase (beta-lactamase class C family)
MTSFERMIVVAAGASVLAFGCASEQRVSPPLPAPTRAAPTVSVVTPPQAFVTRATDYGFADPDRRKKLANAFPAIDEIAAVALRTQNLPGLEIGVVIDGELAHARGFGVVDFDSKKAPDAATVFRIGSITKSFTALSILALRDEGKIGLDDPLTRYLPEAAGLVYPSRDSKPITIRQLLTHTSGLPRLGRFKYTRTDAEPNEAEILGSLGGFALENAPGTKFVYSNLGFALLGLVVGRVAKMPYQTFVASRIFKPLGMTASAFEEADVAKEHLATAYAGGAKGASVPTKHWRLGAAAGLGGIYSTAEDLARYVAFQLSAYPPRDDDDGPIARSSVREAHLQGLPHGFRVRDRAEARPGEPTVDAYSSSYGFAWVTTFTCQLNYVWHNGGVDGFASAIGFVPERGVGVVVLANFLDADLDSVLEKSLLALEKTGGLVARKPKIGADPAFDVAVKRLLAVERHWDEGAFKKMLTPNRSVSTSEEEELARYRDENGACTRYRTLELATPIRGKVVFECERGQLEMSLHLDPTDHLIAGFDGTSIGIAAPAKLAPAANAISKLLETWDHRLYAKVLAPRSKKSEAETETFFAELRGRHRGCSRTTAERNSKGDFTIMLVCKEGGDLRLALAVDEKAPDVIESYSITPASRSGTCPVR